MDRIWSCFNFKLVLFKAFLFCILASHIVSDINVPVRVKRRLTGDIYYDNLTNFYICHDDDNLTFLVSERRCVKNQELLNGIIFVSLVSNNWADRYECKLIFYCYNCSL